MSELSRNRKGVVKTMKRKTRKIDTLSNPQYRKLLADVQRYCWRYQKRCEEQGKGTQYRTFRMIAKRFGLPHAEIELLADDSENLDCLSAVGISGVGYADIEQRGDWMIECINEPEQWSKP